MDFALLRHELVRRTIANRGVKDLRVLEALSTVPREEFVPVDQQNHAYEDGPLFIGAGQTISQPYIVGLMVEAMQMKPTDRVLDVGTGSGYAAAVMSHLAGEVRSIERISSLALTAQERLVRLGYTNVFVHVGDGTLGLPSHAPFDAIAVAASGPTIPHVLVSQLVEGGRIVIPVQSKEGLSQNLMLGIRVGDGLRLRNLGDVRFVPLIGEHGHKE